MVSLVDVDAPFSRCRLNLDGLLWEVELRKKDLTGTVLARSLLALECKVEDCVAQVETVRDDRAGSVNG